MRPPVATDTIAPTLDLAFTGALDPRISISRAAGGATYYDATNTLQLATANAPRLDYGPTGTAPKGLLVEETRTNSINNPRAEGAVPGTPGTMPTNWAATNTAGLTLSVIGTGNENGVPYVDLHYVGTSSATTLTLVLSNFGQIAAAQNSVWTVSSYIRLIGGTLAGVTGAEIDMQSGDASLATLSTYVGTSTPFSAAALATQRLTTTATLTDATIAWVRPRFLVMIGTGQAIDITVRIGAPQLELGAFATSTILPAIGTPAITTRAGDTVTIAAGAWTSTTQGSLAVTAIPQTIPATQNTEFLGIGSANTDITRLDIQVSTSLMNMQIFQSSANVGSASTANSATAGAVTKAGCTYTATAMQVCMNGGTVASAVNTGLPSSVTTAYLGGSGRGGMLNGWLQRVRFWPRALSAGELQSATT